MSKRWTRKEDDFLYMFFDVLGDYIGTHDLGRPPGAAAKRVAKLKTSGAWAALDRIAAAERDYHIAVGRPRMDDLEEAAT